MTPKQTAFVIATILLLASSQSQAQPSAYSNEVMSLNPAGYWPMHELEAAAQGDIETNYGSLGVLGAGYYPDWAAGSITDIKRGVPGALANDTDTAVNFIHAGTTPAGSYTNDVYIPHTSPLSTLKPPFTVECWFYPTNTTSEDIWAQDGWEGLNAGNAGGGVGNASGIRLVWENGTTTGFEIYSVNNSPNQNTIGFSGVSGQNVSPLNNWYHLVVTCDAGTNISLYTNGVQASLSYMQTTNGPGSYSPDYWTPLTIGGGRGGTRSGAGYVDEFAVYTNVITDIARHYSDGINESHAGVYVADVMNDHPVIYLRMDASAIYSPPPVGTWPMLFNYGSAGANGLYTPGSMPGILPGPASPAGILYAYVTNDSALFSGVSSFADAGYAPAFNPTGSNANFTVTALFRGYPCDGRVQTIVGHGANSWQLSIATNGCLVFNAGNGNQATEGTGQAAGDLMTMGVYNDGNWHQVVAVNQTNVISIYVDGALDTIGTPGGITTTSVIPGNTDDLMIGSDPSYTNNPVGVGRSFAGQICDVAFFTNALTAGQISALYLGTETPVNYAPAPPASTATIPGGTLTLTAGATGTPPLWYQWQIIANGGTNVLATGSTNGVRLNASLTVPAVPLSWNGGQLRLTVTNVCGTNTAFTAVSFALPGTPNSTNINIVWDDEFNGTSIDRTRWTFETGNGGWGNNELEYYTSSSQNAYVSNGILHIVALVQSMATNSFTSARMTTEGLYNTPTYGILEWRAQLPEGVGMWPALWLLGSNYPTAGWPGCGEIDVLENDGADPGWVQGSLHWGTSGEQSDTAKYDFPSPETVTNWHTYDLSWNPGSIQFLVDGNLYETQSVGAPFNQPFFFIMNIAVGGNYVGNPTIAQIEAGTTFPAQMLVDYVRVYEFTAPLAISTAARPEGGFTLSWPTNIVCHLQAQTNSLLGTWYDVTSATNPFVISPDPNQSAVYYRLESP